MSRAEYIVIVGLICLCLFVAPAMAESKACSKCVPEVKPAFGSSCPLPCEFELGASFWSSVGAGGGFDANGFLQSDLLVVDPSVLLEQDPLKGMLPGASIFGEPSAAGFKIPVLTDSPTIDLPNSIWSDKNVADELKAQYVQIKQAPVLIVR